MNFNKIFMILIVLLSLQIYATNIATKKQKNTQMDKTCAIIKPNAVKAGHTGEIINLIELNGFTIKQIKKTQLSPEKAKKFYAIHKEKPFFSELVDYMTSGPLVALELEKHNAIEEWRQLIGATNPQQAAPGTIRRMFGKSVTYNAAHGSDSAQNAAQEIRFFFNN